MALNLNTDLALINTNTNVGTITLPASATSQGRVLTFKDIQGTFGRNTLTLICNGSDTFEDNSTSKILRESYGSIQIVASGTKWYLLNGTQVNTVQTSTLIADSISSFNISTINANISTLQFIDNRFSTNQLNISSAFLYYNNYVIAGTRVGYSNILNRFRFSPYSLPNLAGWYDGADPLGTGTPPTNGTILQTWFDKSANKNNATQPTLSNRPTYNVSNIVFNGTNNYLPFINPGALVENTSFSIFIVEQRATAANNNFIMGGTNILINYLLHLGYTTQNLFKFAFYGNDLNYASLPNYIPGSEPYRLWDCIFRSPGRNIVLNGSIVATDTNAQPIISWVGGCIGAYAPPTGNWYNGSIAEILFYNKALPIGNQQQIEGYLAWKWGIQGNLPASHPFKNAPP